jgi:hypothetical protein
MDIKMEKIITIPEIPAKYDSEGNIIHAAIPETTIYNHGPNQADDDFLKIHSFLQEHKKD